MEFVCGESVENIQFLIGNHVILGTLSIELGIAVHLAYDNDH